MKNTTRFWSFAIPSVLALSQAQSAVLDEGVTLEIGEVVINEFMASNDGGQTSNPNDWYPITNQINGTTHPLPQLAQSRHCMHHACFLPAE